MISSEEYLELAHNLNLLIKIKFPNKFNKIYFISNFTWTYLKDNNHYCLICEENIFNIRINNMSLFFDMIYNHGIKHLKEYNLLSFL